MTGMKERAFDIEAANRDEALEKANAWVTRMNKITEATYQVIDAIEKEGKHQIVVSQL